MSSTQQRAQADVQESEGDCPECDGQAITDGQETVCEDCGLILEEDRMDHGAEWRSFNQDQKEERARVGQPSTATLHDGGAGAEIGWYRDANGDQLAEEKRKRLARQRQYHTQVKAQSRKARTRKSANAEILRMASALDIGTTEREQACRLFNQAHEADVIKNRSIEAFASAAIYAVARINQCATLRSDVAGVSRVSDQHIRGAYATLNQELGLPTPPPDPRQYLGRIASALDLDEAARRSAREWLDDVGDGGKTAAGGTPAATAGACIVLAVRDRPRNERPSQKAIAAAGDVAPRTVRQHRDAILEAVDDA